jgi:hypothetical protein
MATDNGDLIDNDWAAWQSGDAMAPPDGKRSPTHDEFLLRLVKGCRCLTIDWNSGDRWIESNIAHAKQSRFPDILIEADQSLIGRTALVTITEGLLKVHFFLTPDTSLIGLYYEADAEREVVRQLAMRLADILCYSFDTAID